MVAHTGTSKILKAVLRSGKKMSTHFGKAAPFNTPADFSDKPILHHCDCEQLCAEVLSLKNIIVKLEKDFKDSVESNLNREVYFREAVDTKFQKMEEFVKEAVEALGKEVVECLRRRDKQWTKQLREKNVPEVAVPPPTETVSVPSTICSSSPLTDYPAISMSSPTQDRATEGTTTAMTSTGPAVTYIFSVLPFSSEEIISAQQDDATLSISTSTHQTDRITVHNHQGLLYRRIQGKRGQQRIQLVVPKALIQRTLQSLHERTTESHHSRLKTLLNILEVAWWPTVRKDVWRYVGDCKGCNVINHSPEPSRHCTSTPTVQRGRRNQQTERRASNAGYRKHRGGTAQPTQGYPAWYRSPLHCYGSPIPSSKLVPAWGCLVLSNLFQRHFNTHGEEDTHFMDNG